MKSARFLLPCLMVAFCLHSQAQTVSFLKAEGKRIVNEEGKDVSLRGIGLGGWMVQEGYMLRLNKEGQQHRIRERIDSIIGKEKTAEFYSLWLTNNTTKSDIDSLHAWGFNSVRLPMHYNLYTLAVQDESVTGLDTWLPTGFNLTDSLISWCKSNGMYVFPDLHAAPGGQGNDVNISDRDPSKPSLWQSEANKQKTIALWKKIAARYANEPTVGGYDILNEPNWGFADTLNDRNGLKEKGNAPLRQLMIDITKAIREVDTKHIIIIEGNGWGNNYAGLLPTWDNNMVLSFHKYWNNNDQQSIQYIVDYREKYNVPVWLGETGENSNTWFTGAIRLFEQNHIGWAWWPLKKLGINNQLQIQSNAGYDSLVNYWNGKTTAVPSPASAYRSLMELAANAKNENNIVHRDVIDAMMRQPFSNESKPFKANLVYPGDVIMAVDYDLGVNYSAYYDLDSGNYRLSNNKETVGNKGRVYRNDGVDIYEDSANKGTYYVGSMEEHEMLAYTINVQEAGAYTLLISIASESGKGTMTFGTSHHEIGYQKQSDTERSNTAKFIFANYSKINEAEYEIKYSKDLLISVPATGGNDKWENVKVTGINLTKGLNKIFIGVYKAGFNFKSIEFLK